MSGFPVARLRAWVESIYGPCTITKSHVQEAVPNDMGVDVLGPDMIFLNVEIVFRHRHFDANIQQQVGQMLYDLGAKSAAPFSRYALERDGVTLARLTYMVEEVSLV